MLERLLTRLAELFARAYRRVASIPLVRRVNYPIRNRRGFTNLYEHDKMLADHVRIDTYAAAIARSVRPGDVVVDLGTGSGILAFLAARAGAARVHALDDSLLIADARRVARDNGITNMEFHHVHSRDFRAAAEVDVIVHEQIGEALFDERMVESIVDLRDRVLRRGGRIVPARFELHVDPVELVPDAIVPFAWEQRLHGVDFRALEETGRLQRARYRRRLVYANQVARRLCGPAPLFEIDLEEVPEPALPPRCAAGARVSAPGSTACACRSWRASTTTCTSTRRPARRPTAGRPAS